MICVLPLGVINDDYQFT